MLSKLLSLVFKMSGGLTKLLPTLIQMLSEGRFGAAPAHVYAFLAGKKTLIAVVLYGAYAAALAIAPYVPQAGDVAKYILEAANIALVVGLYDGAVRFPGTPEGGSK